MMTPVLAFIAGLIVACQALNFDPPQTPFKYSAIHASLRKDVDAVAEVLIRSALGINKMTSIMFTSRLADVMDVHLHALVENLARASNFTRAKSEDKIQFCCTCGKCDRRCRQCNKSCCCKGSGGCHCTSCLSKSTMTFESIMTPLHTFDDLAKNWAIESKEELRNTVKSFFVTILTSSSGEAASVDFLQNKQANPLDHGIAMVDSLIDKLLVTLN